MKNIVIEFEEEKLNFEELEKYKKSTKMSYGNSILSNNKYNQSFAEKKES